MRVGLVWVVGSLLAWGLIALLGFVVVSVLGVFE